MENTVFVEILLKIFGRLSFDEPLVEPVVFFIIKISLLKTLQSIQLGRGLQFFFSEKNM